MRKIFYTIILFSLFSCNDNPVSTPDNLLGEEVMVDILYDIAILQAAEGYVPEELNSKNIKVDSFIYDKYEIDSITYYQNHKYYAADVKKYKKMYTEVIDRIDSKSKKFEGEGQEVKSDNSAKDSKAVYVPEVN